MPIEMTAYLPLAGPLLLFAFAASITPGPNNLMLTASGASFGFVRTVPHMAGIYVGFLSLLLAVAGGLGALFQAIPVLHVALKFAGSAYLLYLAWRIASAGPWSTDPLRSARPLTWWQAALFQYANPKGWIMALTAISAFTAGGDRFMWSALAVALTFCVVLIPCIACWAGFGSMIGRLFRTRRAQIGVNVVLGVLTAATVVFIVR